MFDYRPFNKFKEKNVLLKIEKSDST